MNTNMISIINKKTVKKNEEIMIHNNKSIRYTPFESFNILKINDLEFSLNFDNYSSFVKTEKNLIPMFWLSENNSDLTLLFRDLRLTLMEENDLDFNGLDGFIFVTNLFRASGCKCEFSMEQWEKVYSFICSYADKLIFFPEGIPNEYQNTHLIID